MCRDADASERTNEAVNTQYIYIQRHYYSDEIESDLSVRDDKIGNRKTRMRFISLAVAAPLIYVGNDVVTYL